MLKLPDDLLKKIGTVLFSMKLEAPSYSEFDMSHECLVVVLVSLCNEIYRKANISEEKKQKIFGAYIEVVSNALDHGNNNDINKKIVSGLWFGTDGLVYYVQDEGDFYTSIENKKKVEAKITLPSTREIPGGDGMWMIYEADEIFVSTDDNAIYCFFSLKP